MSAMKGHINAMFNLGAMFYTGEGIPQNKEEGFKFLKMAASFGHEQAMYLLADILLEDPNTEEEGINYLKMSAEKGYVNSMIKYIGIKMYKDGLDYSDPYLMRYIKMAADHGDMNSKLLCEWNGIGEGAPGYTEEAARNAKKLADEGDIQSMFTYGKMLYSGEGVEEDKEEAAKYFKKAADLGEPQAIFYYGKMLLDGEGVPENKNKGMDYVQEAGATQDINAMYLYGKLLLNGDGIPADKKEASMYLSKSADRGYKPAMFYYRKMLLTGDGIPMDKEKGQKYIKQATHWNHDMMYEYGEMLRNGDGIPIDKYKASQYFQKAINLINFKAMVSLGVMKVVGEGIPVNYEDGMALLKLAADHHEIEGMKKYAGFLLISRKKEDKIIASQYLKMASEKGDPLSFYIFKYIFHKKVENIESYELTSKLNNAKEIKVNTYQQILFETNNFLILQHSTISKQIIDELTIKFQNYKDFRGIQSNLVHQNDPNSLYTFFHFSHTNVQVINHILTDVMKKHNIKYLMPKWNIDIFFDEKIVPQKVLDLLFKKLKTVNEITGITRSIFDGRQIATYLVVNPIFRKYDKIYETIHKLLLPKNLVFDKILYRLENNIIMNEKMILKNEDDFDFIVNEIKKIGLDPINIERDRLYLYGNYFIKKLFQRFSFICFNSEIDKMKALNHINSIIYANNENVLKYKLNLHYGKIDDSAYPKNVRDNLVILFNSFKGFEDIQEHVLSIENPVVRTYVGFDSIKNLKKAYRKFFHYVDILRYGINTKIFIKKKNLIYLFVIGKVESRIENIISSYFASDVQKDCTEFRGNVFARNISSFIKASFYGFNGLDNFDKAINLLKSNPSSSELFYSKYHEFSSFNETISEVPEEYLFYDSF